MASTYRRLLPQTLTYSSSYYSYSYSPSPSPSPSPSVANACLIPCDPSCPSDSNCPWTYSSPPPPPPPPSFFSPPYNPSPSGSRRLSTPGIIAVSLVSTLFLLTVYLILLARSRRNRRNRPNNRGPHQGPPPPPGDGGQWGEEEWNQNQAMVHPIWLINTVGLQPAVIGSIGVCEYKKGEGLIEGDYCSICLSEFEEGENLRLLPKCSHAFHIPCIDTWLRSHTNCPLCRAPILSPAPASSSIAVVEPDGSGSGAEEDVGENTDGGDTAMADTGDSSGVAEGRNGDEGLNDKSGVEEVEVGALVGSRSVSMDGNVSNLVNMDGEGNRRGGVRSLPGSGRFCRPGSDC